MFECFVIPLQEIAVSGADTRVHLYDCRQFEKALDYLSPRHLRDSSETVTGVRFDYSGDRLLLSYNDDDIYLIDSDPCCHLQEDWSKGTKCEPTGDSKESDNDEEDGSSDNEQQNEQKEEIVEKDAGESSDEHGFKMRFTGHRNADTVKQVCFLGDRSEFVVSGSDCGHVFIWRSSDGGLVKVFKADRIGAINCLSPHPSLPVLCTSGLEHTAKIWAPYGPHISLGRIGSRARNEAKKIISRNRRVSRHLNPGQTHDAHSTYSDGIYVDVQGTAIREEEKEMEDKRVGEFLRAAEAQVVQPESDSDEDMGYGVDEFGAHGAMFDVDSDSEGLTEGGDRDLTGPAHEFARQFMDIDDLSDPDSMEYFIGTLRIHPEMMEMFRRHMIGRLLGNANSDDSSGSDDDNGLVMDSSGDGSSSSSSSSSSGGGCNNEDSSGTDDTDGSTNRSGSGCSNEEDRDGGINVDDGVTGGADDPANSVEDNGSIGSASVSSSNQQPIEVLCENPRVGFPTAWDDDERP
jgi:hypothetical protein